MVSTRPPVCSVRLLTIHTAKGGAPFCSPVQRYHRVLRGGSWFGNSDFLRSANRGGYSTDGRNVIVGFRVGLETFFARPSGLLASADLATR